MLAVQWDYRHRRLALLIAAFLLLALGAATHALAIPTADPRKTYSGYVSSVELQIEESYKSKATIALFGDSEIARSHFEERVGNIVNYGVEGDTVEGTWIRLRHYDLSRVRTVIIEVGTNDFFDHRTLVGIGNKYSKMLDEIPPNIRIIAIGILPNRYWLTWKANLKHERAKGNREIQAACLRRPGCKYIDPGANMTTTDGALDRKFDSGDRLHVSTAAYDEIWAHIAPIIRSDVP